MENRGLIFIPDISGFTEFVNNTEIEHSRLIIQELLEILINANKTDLKISEIEGDAILFYKFGDPPELDKLYMQVEKMFCDFHSHLLAYDVSKYCQCKACTSAAGLTLKIISHYGEFTGFNVSKFNKLFGKDIILAHQLLKNDIKHHEYWLVTPQLSGNEDILPSLYSWMNWNTGTKQTEEGGIPFHYTMLSSLKDSIAPVKLEPPDLSLFVKLTTHIAEFNKDIITLFHAAGDFSYRHFWMEGVKKVEKMSHFLPRIGMKCRYIMKDGQTNIYSSSYNYSSEKISFSETDENNINLIYFILDKIDDSHTKLTLEHYIRKDVIETHDIRNKKKRMDDIYNRSLKKLTELVKELDFKYVE